MKVFCFFVSLVVTIKAGYHEEVGIPLAARIKEYEDKLFAEDPEMTSRVVGKLGESRSLATENSYPYMAGMIIERTDGLTSTCAAVIVNAYRLVTAATCLSEAKTLRVRLGSMYLYHGGTEIKTDKFIKHPRYFPSRSADYDIGLVILPEMIEFSDSVKAANFPYEKMKPEAIGEWGLAAGWGFTDDTQHDRPVYKNVQLSEVALQIMNATLCKEMYVTTYDYAEDTVCTDGTGARGICTGDTGGPLVIDRNGTKVVIGIASMWWRTCEESMPSVFTKVQSFYGFVCCYRDD